MGLKVVGVKKEEQEKMIKSILSPTVLPPGTVGKNNETKHFLTSIFFKYTPPPKKKEEEKSRP